MSRTTCRILSAVVGVAIFAVAGWLLGGSWWLAAGLGAAASIASQVDHRVGHLVVAATLACSVGAAAAGREWLIVVVVAGSIASIELAAGADRVTAVRPSVSVLPRTASTTLGAAALAALVVLLGRVDGVVGSWTAVVAAAFAVVALRLLVR